jgi:hypothetical protein
MSPFFGADPLGCKGECDCERERNCGLRNMNEEVGSGLDSGIIHLNHTF